MNLSGAFLVFILLTFNTLGWGQPCHDRLSGVISGDAGDPLPNAVVTLADEGKQVITDLKGRFTFEGICPGNFKVVVSFIGYETAVLSVSVPADDPVLIAMTPSQTVLEDVVVESVSAPPRGATQTSVLLEDNELAALHGRPLGESLKEIPGVNALQTGPAIFKPVIDGLHSQRILILNNGIRQEGQQWGVEHAPEVDPFIASQIEVLKGAETVRYGSAAMGGVIIINPPPLHQTEKIGGELNLGLMSNNRMAVFSGLVEGTLAEGSDWSWRLQSSVKRGGDYHAPKYTLSNTGLKEFNFSGAIGFEDDRRGLEVYASSFNSEIGILRAAHTGNLNDLAESIESGRPWFIDDFSYEINAPRQLINHHLLKVSAHQQVKNLGKVTVLYGGQYNKRREFDIRRGGRDAKPSLNLSLLSHVLDVSLDHKHDAHSGSVGINATYKLNRNDTQETGVVPLLPDFQQASGGLFILEKWNNRKWVLEAGGRYDFQHLTVLTFLNNQQLIRPQFNFNFLSATLGATHLFSEKFRILSNLGISSRPPHVSELYSEGLHHGTASVEEGLMRVGGSVLSEQSEVRMERSKKWVTTARYGDENLEMDLSFHYNDIDNYVFIRPVGTRLTVRGYFPVFRYEQTDAMLTGTDAAIKWRITERLTANSKFSYIYAKDQTNDDVLIFIPPAQWENGLTYTIPQLGRMEEFQLAVSVPMTFRQSRAPVVVSPRDITDTTLPEKVFDFAPAPAGYTLINLRAGFKLPLGEHSLGFTFTAENLLNTTYRNYMNRLRYYADDVGSNFIVRVSYNFLSH